MLCSDMIGALHNTQETRTQSSRCLHGIDLRTSMCNIKVVSLQLGLGLSAVFCLRMRVPLMMTV